MRRQHARAQVATTLTLDAFTELDVRTAGETNALDVEGSWALVPGFLFSLGRTHLRVGLGYGNYNVPGVNFVLPKPRLYPMLDLFWRIGRDETSPRCARSRNANGTGAGRRCS